MRPGPQHPPVPGTARRVLPAVAVVLWAGMIFWFSAQPDLSVSDDDTLDFVLRKLAHVVVFTVLFVLLSAAFDPRARLRSPRPDRRALAAAWVCTVLYAASDEWHQTFTRGRVGQASDVMIDMIGPTLLAAWLAWRAARERGTNPPSTEHTA